MDLHGYFARIGYEGPQTPTLETLQALHLLHPLAIPFENLSSFSGEEVSLDPDAVYGKLVEKRRGGYCFEHNLLFASALEQIGFTVSRHAARVVWRSPDKTQMPRTHKLLRITIDGEHWIADVGFGGLTMTAPLRLVTDIEQDSPHESFRITRDGEDYCIAARLGDRWAPMYVFDLVAQYPADFDMANFYVSSHPQSLFRHNLMLGRPFRKGRHALLNTQYTKYNLDGRKTEKQIANVNEFMSLLQDIFTIGEEGLENADRLRSLYEALAARETEEKEAPGQAAETLSENTTAAD